MTAYILDTDIVGFVQQAHPTVLQYLHTLSPADAVATTIITIEEDIGGWLPACRRARGGAAREQAYARLQKALLFYQRVAWLPFTDAAATLFDQLRAQKLRFQRRQSCGAWRHPPRLMCNSCHSLQWEWMPTKGKGKVYCWPTVHQALDPAFTEAVPYAAVVVELDEGPRLTTWVTGISPDELQVGMAVELWFDNVTDEVRSCAKLSITT